MINVKEVKSDFWKKEVQVGKVEIGPTTELRVSVVETARGAVKLNVREWTRYKNGEFGPTKSGFTMDVESIAEFQELMLRVPTVVEDQFA